MNAQELYEWLDAIPATDRANAIVLIPDLKEDGKVVVKYRNDWNLIGPYIEFYKK